MSSWRASTTFRLVLRAARIGTVSGADKTDRAPVLLLAPAFAISLSGIGQ